MAAYPYLHDQSIVMIDDSDLPHGGKGKFVIDFLLERGWIIIAEAYQVILVKEILNNSAVSSSASFGNNSHVCNR